MCVEAAIDFERSAPAGDKVGIQKSVVHILSSLPEKKGQTTSNALELMLHYLLKTQFVTLQDTSKLAISAVYHFLKQLRKHQKSHLFLLLR